MIVDGKLKLSRNTTQLLCNKNNIITVSWGMIRCPFCKVGLFVLSTTDLLEINLALYE
jgi:hypothetical protein